jgi:predicted HicB family RNase H-like nuclease
MSAKTFYIRRVPEEVARQAKAAAALKGQSLEEFVIDAVKAALPKPPAKK